MTTIKRLYLQEKLYPEFTRHVKITRMVMHVNLRECSDAILYKTKKKITIFNVRFFFILINVIKNCF